MFALVTFDPCKAIACEQSFYKIIIRKEELLQILLQINLFSFCLFFLVYILRYINGLWII